MTTINVAILLNHCGFRGLCVFGMYVLIGYRRAIARRMSGI
jgi:hypothetical protein